MPMTNSDVLAPIRELIARCNDTVEFSKQLGCRDMEFEAILVAALNAVEEISEALK